MGTSGRIACQTGWCVYVMHCSQSDAIILITIAPRTTHHAHAAAGVPAFFRWLSEKYPRTVIDMIEQRPHTVDGVVVRGQARRGSSSSRVCSK